MTIKQQYTDYVERRKKYGTMAYSFSEWCKLRGDDPCIDCIATEETCKHCTEKRAG